MLSICNLSHLSLLLSFFTIFTFLLAFVTRVKEYLFQTLIVDILQWPLLHNLVCEFLSSPMLLPNGIPCHQVVVRIRISVIEIQLWHIHVHHRGSLTSVDSQLKLFVINPFDSPTAIVFG